MLPERQREQEFMGARDDIEQLGKRIGEAIIGQEGMIERLLLGLLSNGHLLVEGLPGLAKTRAIKSMAKNLDAELSRIQFTPDLLPADITGSEIYFPMAARASFAFRRGPSSPISSWRTRSTVRRPRCNRLCSKRWRNVRSPSAARATRCRTCSW